MSALKLEATEDVLRRLDAYLDATHLHVVKKSSKLLWQIEKLDRELYAVYGGRTIHPGTVQLWSRDRQKRHLDAMQYRAKNLLKRVLELKGIPYVRLPDGTDYWRWKESVCKRFQNIALVLSSGDACDLLRADPMGKSRFL